MAGLPYLPKSLLDTTSTWDFASTTQSALSSLQEAGSRLMQPVGQQLADVVRSSLPEPAAPPQPQPPAMPAMPSTQSMVGIPSFKLPSLESWGMGAAPAQPPARPPEPIDMGPQPSPTAQAPSGPAQAPSGGILGPGSFQGFSLPSLADWGIGAGGPSRPSAAPGAAPAGPTQPSGPPRPVPPGPAPEQGGDLRQYARAVAVRAGIDPGIFEKQITQESGFDPKAVSPAGAQGIAQFMPATAKGVGLADPFDPYAALEAAARHMADNLRNNGGDYARALAAYNAGQGNVDKHGGVPPFAETQQYVRAILGDARPKAQPAQSVQPGAAAQTQGAPRPGTYAPEALVPNQITEGAAQGLTAEEALAVCGPAAAVAFARANGRNPTLGEAKQLAQSTGVWDASTGMHGPASEVQLLQKMGVGAQLQEGADWTRVAQEVSAGKPVIIDTPQHYFVASAFDPQTGEFEFGQSAGVLRAAKGRTRFKPQDLPSLNMGNPRATIYLTGGQPP